MYLNQRYIYCYFRSHNSIANMISFLFPSFNFTFWTSPNNNKHVVRVNDRSLKVLRELQKAKLQKFSKKKSLNSKPENEIRLGGFTWEIIRNIFHQILGAILSRRTLFFCNLPLILQRLISAKTWLM